MVIIRKPTNEEKMLMEWFHGMQMLRNGVIVKHIVIVENLLETFVLSQECRSEIENDQVCLLTSEGVVERIPPLMYKGYIANLLEGVLVVC